MSDNREYIQSLIEKAVTEQDSEKLQELLREILRLLEEEQANQR